MNKTCIRVLEYYSAIKRNEILLHATCLTNLRTLGSVKKARLHSSPVVWFLLYEIFRTGKSVETKIQLVPPRGGVEEEWRVFLGAFLGHEKVLTLERGGRLCNIGDALTTTELFTLKWLITEISLTGQWLRLLISNAQGTRLIPGWETKIPRATQHGQKVKDKWIVTCYVNFTLIFKKRIMERGFWGSAELHLLNWVVVPW